jgi:hypothetical protein
MTPNRMGLEIAMALALVPSLLVGLVVAGIVVIARQLRSPTPVPGELPPSGRRLFLRTFLNAAAIVFMLISACLAAIDFSGLRI